MPPCKRKIIGAFGGKCVKAINSTIFDASSHSLIFPYQLYKIVDAKILYN